MNEKEKDNNENSKVTNIEISNKIEALIKKIITDISNCFLESVNLEELKKTLKVI